MSRPGVAVNLLWCVPEHVGGSEEYLARQLVGLAGLPPATIPGDVTIYAPRGYAGVHPEVHACFPIVASPDVGLSRPRRVALESTWLFRRTRHAGVVHHAGGTVPALSRRPIVLTIHDLQYRSYPQYLSPLKLRYLSHQIPAAVKRAAVITVPSNYVKATLGEAFAVDPERIVVVPGAVPGDLGAVATPEDELRRCYGLLGRRVLVYPAATFPHKRHDFLLRMMARHWTDPDLCLVLLGGDGLAAANVTRLIDSLGLQARVVRPGRVSPADRDGLIRLAEALVFPSEYEGFGAPLVEAMALGTPVVASDRACIPEVVGDAGLVLPLEPEAWSDVPSRVGRLGPQLIEAGIRRAREFTADRSGTALAQAYTMAAGWGSA
jgi:glycosyltransferase involved in cell wall biosynthesis